VQRRITAAVQPDELTRLVAGVDELREEQQIPASS
jgi:hypothetical protein